MFMQPAPCEANGLLLGYAALVITLLQSTSEWIRKQYLFFSPNVTQNCWSNFCCNDYTLSFYFLVFEAIFSRCWVMQNQSDPAPLASILGLIAPPIFSGAGVPVQAQTELRGGNSVSFIQMSMLHQISIFLKIIVLRYFIKYFPVDGTGIKWFCTRFFNQLREKRKAAEHNMM